MHEMAHDQEVDENRDEVADAGEDRAVLQRVSGGEADGHRDADQGGREPGAHVRDVYVRDNLRTRDVTLPRCNVYISASYPIW